MAGVNVNKRIIVHVGPPKTGTSAIQKWLNENSKTLEQHGIYYPNHTVDENGVSSGNVDAIFTRGKDLSDSLDVQKVKLLISKFNETSFSTLILSSEFFFKRVEQLAQVFPDCKFVAYIRNPLEYLESIYNQSVKRHGNTQEIHLPDELNLGGLSLLSKYVQNLGKDRFYLRSYTSASNSGVVEDFLSILEVNVVIGSTFKINRSYTHEALQFKRWLNKFVLEELDQPIDIFLQRQIGAINHYSYIPPDTYIKYQLKSTQVLEAFCKSFNVFGGRDLIEHVKSTKQDKFVEQNLSESELNLLVKELKNYDLHLYMCICSKIHTRSNFLDYSEPAVKIFTGQFDANFFSSSLRILFEKTLPLAVRFKLLNHMLLKFLKLIKYTKVVNSNIKGLIRFRKNLKIDSSNNDIDVVREIALFAEANDNVELAYLLMLEVKKNRPTSSLANYKIQKYAKLLEKKQATKLSLDDQ